MPNIPVTGADSVSYPITVNANGQALMAASKPVVIASDQSPIPVTIGGTVPVSGTLTDTQLRATPLSVAQSGTWTVGVTGSVAVTGAFWQATQPVSLASQPLPTGAATETTIAALNTKTPALGQATMANSRPVVIASNQSAIPVSGTFWQATQPVSGTFWPTIAATVGRLAAAGSRPVVLSNEDLAAINSLATKLDTLHTDLTTTGVTPGTAGTASTDVLTVQGAGVAASPVLVHARQGTGSIYSGDTALTPKFAPIAASASGSNTIVAAVAGKKIRVLGYNLVGSGAVNAKFVSGAGGADLTGLKYIAAAGGGISVPYCPLGWFETASGALLSLNLSGATAVGGELIYVEV